jgi:hypothetical protein
MSKNISQLPQKTNPASVDRLLLEDIAGGATKYVTLADLAAAVGPLLSTNSVAAAALATNAITLGYAQITANVSTNASSAAQAAGLSISVVVPAGSRRVKVSAYIPYAQMTGGTYADITLWDGAVGSGVQLQRWFTKLTDATVTAGVYIEWEGIPAAGSKTYNLGFTTGSAGTTITLNCTPTSPGFIKAAAQ